MHIPDIYLEVHQENSIIKYSVKVPLCLTQRQKDKNLV